MKESIAYIQITQQVLWYKNTSKTNFSRSKTHEILYTWLEQHYRSTEPNVLARASSPKRTQRMPKSLIYTNHFKISSNSKIEIFTHILYPLRVYDPLPRMFFWNCLSKMLFRHITVLQFMHLQPYSCRNNSVRDLHSGSYHISSTIM